MTRLLTTLCALLAWMTIDTARADNRRLEETAQGVRFVALPADPKKTYDTRLLEGAEGLRRLKASLARLISRSPFSAKKLEILKASGQVSLVYLPGDAPKSPATGENVAVFMPKFIDGRDSKRKHFLVVVGRHGIKWTTDELAAVLAHELVGHGIQHQRGRTRQMRPIDLECEAYLYEELANQDLALDKFSAEMVRFRKGLELHWCADFKIYMRANRRGDLALWDTLNPDIPRLLAIFEDYVRHAARTKRQNAGR